MKKFITLSILALSTMAAYAQQMHVPNPYAPPPPPPQQQQGWGASQADGVSSSLRSYQQEQQRAVQLQQAEALREQTRAIQQQTEQQHRDAHACSPYQYCQK